MAVESKPLFHPEVIRQQVRSFNLPESVGDWQPKLQHWAGLLASGRADDFKETALLPDFLTDIFCGLLGYIGPVGAQSSSSARSQTPGAQGGAPCASSLTTDQLDIFTFSREVEQWAHRTRLAGVR